MDMNGEFILRMTIAGLLGAAVGFEREYRAKEAGTRTHFLVAVGSCLMMIVSQWGFQDLGVMNTHGLDIRGDVTRVAAQIVSGIGFIGAGTIMMQKQVV
ncbi:MAG: MgtC/SapB family protein, partial [Lentisphaeria bacterium]|nr:MgtC/SapB family protein [Lentisphaeria bacterium]